MTVLSFFVKGSRYIYWLSFFVFTPASEPVHTTNGKRAPACISNVTFSRMMKHIHLHLRGDARIGVLQ